MHDNANRGWSFEEGLLADDGSESATCKRRYARLIYRGMPFNSFFLMVPYHFFMEPHNRPRDQVSVQAGRPRVSSIVRSFSEFSTTAHCSGAAGDASRADGAPGRRRLSPLLHCGG